jgi:hypothetical protein
MPATPKPATTDDLNTITLDRSSGRSKAGQSYDVQQLRFPENTMGDPDLQHSVLFLINVRGKSKAKDRAGGSNTEIIGNDTGSVSRQQLGENIQGMIKPIAIAGSAYLANSLAQQVAANSAAGASAKVKVLGTLGAITAGALIGNAAGDEIAQWFEPDKRFRIKTAIQLAINERPSVKYGVQYGTTDLGTMGGFLGGGASALDYNSMLPEVARKAMINLASVPAGIAANLTGDSNFDLGGAISAATAMTPNPFREQIFQSVDNRTFTFDYKFLPKNEQESRKVKNIITEFKYHMHPELSAGGLFYIYPSEFNIVYFFGKKENPWVHKISTCVLTDMSIDYGNNSTFGTFYNGAPNEVNMKLTFRELEVLTKERIDPGGY